MKKNTKNRKLKYIREKNILRLNRNSVKCYAKISKELLESINEDQFEEQVKIFIEESIEKIYKKFKLYANGIHFAISPFGVDDDFIYNLTTMKVTLSNFRKYKSWE